MSPFCSYLRRYIHTFLLIAILFTIPLHISHARTVFSFSAKEYVNQKYLDSETIQLINQNGYVRGTGAVEYQFLVTNEDTGWYELWIDAAEWPTDIFLDEVLIAHTALPSKLWPKSGNLQKVFNLDLNAGNHSIRFERLYFPGLPYIHNIVLKPSTNISGWVHAKPETNALVFRRNEAFQLSLATQKSLSATALTLSIRDTSTSKIIANLKHSVASGMDLDKSSDYDSNG